MPNIASALANPLVQPTTIPFTAPRGSGRLIIALSLLLGGGLALLLSLAPHTPSDSGHDATFWERGINLATPPQLQKLQQSLSRRSHRTLPVTLIKHLFQPYEANPIVDGTVAAASSPDQYGRDAGRGDEDRFKKKEPGGSGVGEFGEGAWRWEGRKGLAPGGGKFMPGIEEKFPFMRQFKEGRGTGSAGRGRGTGRQGSGRGLGDGRFTREDDGWFDDKDTQAGDEGQEIIRGREEADAGRKSEAWESGWDEELYSDEMERRGERRSDKQEGDRPEDVARWALDRYERSASKVVDLSGDDLTAAWERCRKAQATGKGLMGTLRHLAYNEDRNLVGLIIEVENLHGFMPSSSFDKRLFGRDVLVGQQISVNVTQVDEEKNLLLLASRQLEYESVEIGDVVLGHVVHVDDEFATVHIGCCLGLLTKSELTDRRVDNMADLLRERALIKALVIRKDRGHNGHFKNIGLSTKRLERQHGDALHKKVKVGDVITGIIVKVLPNFALVEVRGDTGVIKGMLHRTDVSNEPISNLEGILFAGRRIKALVINKDEKKERFTLSTRKLEKRHGDMLDNRDAVFETAEEMGRLFREEREIAHRRMAENNVKFENLKVGDVLDGLVGSVGEGYAIIDLGVTGFGYLRKRYITNENITSLDLQDILSAGDPIRALVYQPDNGKGRCMLSTMYLEKNSGDMLYNRAAMFQTAEEMGRLFREKLSQEGAAERGDVVEMSS